MDEKKERQAGYTANSSDDVLKVASELFDDFKSKENEGNREAPLHLTRIYVGTTKISKFTFDHAVNAELALTETADQRFTLPVLGRCRSRSKAGDIINDANGIYTHIPSECFQLETYGEFSWIGLIFKRERIARIFEALSGEPLNGPLVFEHGLSMGTPERQTFSALTSMIMNDFSSGSSLLNLVSKQTEIDDLLIRSILMAVPHNKSKHLAVPSSPAAPSHVKRAMDYIASNISGPICLEDLVTVSGVSERALHEAFKKFRGMSPMAFARNYRLDRIHQNLLSPEGAETVSDIATKWGIRHLGRFSQAYLERFGESPSVTYRRSYRL